MEFTRMPIGRRRLAAVVAGSLVVGGVAAGSATAVPPGGPVSQSHGAKVKLDRTKVAKGGRIKVTGTNWKAKGSRLHKKPVVTVKLDDLDILAVIPIRNGRFSAWVRIPRLVKAGRHWLRFLAAKPATSVKSKTFTVGR